MEDKKKSSPVMIYAFSLPWWLITAVTVSAVILTAVTAEGKSEEARYGFITGLTLLETVYLLVYKYLLRYVRADYNPYNELPCYLCNMSTLMGLLACYSRSRTVMAFCVTIGFLGALMAFVMPDGPNRIQKLLSVQTAGFYGYHSLLVISSLSFWTMGLYQPAYGDIPAVVMILLGMVVIAHGANVILRRTGLNPLANYIFTFVPDNVILKKAYDLLPYRMIYLILLAPVATALCFVEITLLKLL